MSRPTTKLPYCRSVVHSAVHNIKFIYKTKYIDQYCVVSCCGGCQNNRTLVWTTANVPTLKAPTDYQPAVHPDAHMTVLNVRKFISFLRKSSFLQQGINFHHELRDSCAQRASLKQADVLHRSDTVLQISLSQNGKCTAGLNMRDPECTMRAHLVGTFWLCKLKHNSCTSTPVELWSCKTRQNQ